jgi:hypothetical protein
MPPQSPKYKPPDLDKVIPRRITRDLVLKAIYGEDKRAHPRRARVGPTEKSPDDVVQSPDNEDSPQSLKEIRDWLNTLADREQQANVYTPEYNIAKDPFRRAWSSGTHPRMNFEPLKRIRREGFRSTKFDDILGPIREKLNSEHTPLTEPKEEAYGDLEKLLRKWNAKCLGPDEKPEERGRLLAALAEHRRTKPKAMVGDISKDLLDLSTLELREALHVFRPETASFKDQSVYSLLVALVVNMGVADPDIRDDLELKDGAYRTLLMEVQWRLEPKVENVFKETLKEQMKQARRRKDTKELDRLEVEKQQVNMEKFQKGCQKLKDDLTVARRDLHRKTLKALKESTIWHRALLTSSGVLRTPNLPEMYGHCEEYEMEMPNLIQIQEDILQDVYEKAVCKTYKSGANGKSINVLREISDRCYIRVRKMSALDIKDETQREQVKTQRLAHPGTADIMVKVQVDNEILLNTYREVVDRVSGFEEPMEKIYEAALGKFSIYSAFYNVLVEAAEKEKERQQKEKAKRAKRAKQKKADEGFWESLVRRCIVGISNV